MISDFRSRRHHVAGAFVTRERVRFKSTPNVPQPANPQVVAGAQTQSNVDTAIANAALGNVNTYSPFGSTTYNQTGTTTVDGHDIPSFSTTTSLNPTLQGILTGSENTAASLVPTGGALANQAATSATTPLNFSGVNNDIIRGGPQATYQPAVDTIYKGEDALLEPIFTQQQQDLTDQLARQGIPIGSQAYGNAETVLNTNQNTGRTAALGNAASTGVTAASNIFGGAVQGQNQQIAQQQTAQQNPINLLSKLYSTGVA